MAEPPVGDDDRELEAVLRRVLGTPSLTAGQRARLEQRLATARLAGTTPQASEPAAARDPVPVPARQERASGAGGGRQARPELETTYVWRAEERRGRLSAGLRALVAVAVLVLVGSVLAGVLGNHGSDNRGNLPATGGAMPTSIAPVGSPAAPLTWSSSGQLTVPMVVNPGAPATSVTGNVVAQVMPDRELRLSAAVNVPATTPLVWHVLPRPCTEAVSLLGTPSAAPDVVPPFVGSGGGTALVPADQTHQPLAVVPVDLSTGMPLGCATIPLVPPGLAVTYRPAAEVPANCPVTLPTKPAFSPPAPYSATPPYGGDFSYGTPNLWTALPLGGAWQDLPFSSSGGYAQKIFWWNPAYAAAVQADPSRYDFPPLSVTGRRLDGSAAPLLADRATNVEQAAMVVLVHFPTDGCWQVTGAYQGATLSFVVWIGGNPSSLATPTATAATPARVTAVDYGSCQTDGWSLAALDPTTLADLPGSPTVNVNSANTPWALSADGSTLVTVTYDQGRRSSSSRTV